MKTYLNALLTICGLGLLAGCVGSAEGVVADLDEPTFTPLNTDGHTGANGTPNAALHVYLGDILVWMNSSLPSYNDINSDIANSGIVSDPGGHEIFKHLIECTLNAADVVTVDTDAGPEVFYGKGIVKYAHQWDTNALSLPIMRNVVECIAGFLNDQYTGVPFMQTGANIRNDGGDHSAYTLPEAIWCFNPSMGMHVYVTPDFVGDCETDPQAALHKRYCGDEANCGLIYHGLNAVNQDVDSACVFISTGVWKCNNKPCTETWLDPSIEIPHCVPR